MNRMHRANKFVSRLLRGVLAAAWLFAPGKTPVAQSAGKPPAKAPTGSSLQPKEDPLAPLLQRASDAIDKMDFAAALEPLQKYLAERPDEPYPHFQLGYAYAGLKRAEDAKREFSRTVALDPKMAPAHLNLGLVEMDSDPAAAADEFRRAAELQPTESRPRFLAGLALERAGKFPDAIEQHRAAIALSPNDYAERFALARTLLRAGDAAGAEDQFRAAVSLNAGAGPAKLGLGTALLAQKKYDEASGALADYLKLTPGDKAAHSDRALALLNLDRYDEALAELDLAAAGTVASADDLKMRAEIYMHQKKWSEAAGSLRTAQAAAPQDVELAEWMGRADIELKDYSAAVQILQQAYARDAQNADTLRDLSEALYLNENYAAALEAMDRLAKLETPRPGSWFIRAICYDKLARKAEAIEAYQKFLDQDSGQHDTQDFQARQRILVLQKELGQSKKK
jgi:tetratricopeptide (TPR) repeat protein